MRHLFIGGCGRSGTSFVQKIIISHSKVVGGPEFDFLQPLMMTYRRMITPFHLKRQEFFYDRDSLDQYMRTFVSSALLNKHQENSEVIFFSEKTPNNIDVAEELLTLFPDAFFLNIIRDGRDVLVSHLDVEQRFIKSGTAYHKPSFSLESVCALWNKSIDTYLKLANNETLNNRVINLVYEDLLQYPKRELMRICQSLGLVLEEGMLTPHKKEVRESPLHIDNIWHTEAMLNANFDTSKIGRWQKRLSFFEKRKAEKIMQENLKRLNYLK
ncbi:sulfotransferase [Aureispira sp. CCB-E]|uniref:sulfotransferase family protein n=1 Tax=Aureispira sp. CCB-E TaxID=3051121 RepID=UPI0028688ADC|nr:sulfotransferase [Aureispira sp. CCB-E]WMX15205.1 sulfotransferase [Aureispira sp. CCB-E]